MIHWALFLQGDFRILKCYLVRQSGLKKVNVSHFDDLFAVYSSLTSPEKFTYMPFSQSEDKEEFGAFFQELLESKAPYYLAIIDQSTEKVVGCFSLMRIDTRNRVIEMGWVIYSDRLQKPNWLQKHST